MADLIIDPETTVPYINEAAGPNNDGLGSTSVVNFDQNAGNVGFFGGDLAFPYLTAQDNNNMAMEFTTYLFRSLNGIDS